ncbi:MAG TPA: TMEM175 family protein [Saprospiraceae bacterium]|nr:TMEM175 family protein [Saprospiraceae bacterium]
MAQEPDVETKETTRLETFSDGVFAIAITLLVLDLITTLHPESDEGLITTLLHHWRTFMAFTIGFITILICWINHHIAFEFIKRIDTSFIWINGFLLFVVTITPFSTAILAQYLEKEGSTAVAFFAFNYILISVAATSICSYAYHHRLIPDADRDTFYSYLLIYRFGLFYNIAAFLLSFVSIVIPLILYVLLFISFASPKKLAARVSRWRSAKTGTT